VRGLGFCAMVIGEMENLSAKPAPTL